MSVRYAFQLALVDRVLLEHVAESALEPLTEPVLILLRMLVPRAAFASGFGTTVRR